MASLMEVLVTSDSTNTLWTTSIWDPHTGTSLMSYKGGGTAEYRTLSFLGKDYIASVEKDKPILHVWPLNSQQTVQGIRFILPGKASAFDISQDGSYCIAGINELIYVWQIASGSLLTIINRHYQRIVNLKFTLDGQYFISAAEDGMVMVWSLATVAAHPEVELVTQTVAGQHDPVYVFSDHALPVTDLFISKNGMRGRLCTVSSDRTCKIYDLSTGEMLLNLIFEMSLTAVTMDVFELIVFVGTLEGNIYQFSLTEPPRNRDLLVNNKEDFISHSKSITCLSVSTSGDTLMSGSADENIILWHIKSRQPLRTIKHKGPITNAFFTINYEAIYKQSFTPSIILHSLERTLEKDNDAVAEIEVLVNKKHSFWPEQKQTENDFNVPLKEIEIEYKKKESKLKEEIENLRKINSNLYSFSIQKALESVE